MKILDINYVLQQTPAKEVEKVYLAKTKFKGIGIFAKRPIKKNEIVAYYKVKIFSLKKFNSKTKNMYTIEILTKTGRPSTSLIGDLDDSVSLPKTKRGIPYWGYFANEPSGDQTPNVYIDMNLKENYHTRDKILPGQTYTYKVRAERAIQPGEELVWCYGDDYIRDYDTLVC